MQQVPAGDPAGTSDPSVSQDGNGEQNGSGQAENMNAPGVNVKPEITKPVKTGDYTNVVLPAAVLVLAAAIGGTTVYIRRKRR